MENLLKTGQEETSKTADALLSLSGIRKEFPGVVALDGVDFDLKSGEVHALLGANGAGKSTLISVMSGALSSDGGKAEFCGRFVKFQSPAEALSAGIQVIHQEPALALDMSVLDNLFLGREKRTRSGAIDRSAARKLAREALAKVGADFSPDVLAADLGIGQRQMVEIAKAIVEMPRVLILDEPTSALSEAESRQLFDLLRELVGQGVGVVYVSHRLEEIAPLCARATVLRDGKCVGTFPSHSLDRDRLVRLISGDMSAAQTRKTIERGERLLEVENLSCAKQFRNVSFTAHRGEVVVLTGLVGAGRTEILEVIFGLRKPSGGMVRVADQPLHDVTPRRAIEAGLAFVPEDRRGMGLALDLSIRNNISLPSLRRFLRRIGLSVTAERAHADRQIRELSIRVASADDKVGVLSGGNQQKVVLAKWLTTDAQVYLLDEPTQGVDVGGKSEIYDLIESLKKRGCAIVVVSSDLEEVLHIADRVFALQNGSITGSFDRQNLTAEGVVAAITHGVLA